MTAVPLTRASLAPGGKSCPEKRNSPVARLGSPFASSPHWMKPVRCKTPNTRSDARDVYGPKHRPSLGGSSGPMPTSNGARSTTRRTGAEGGAGAGTTASRRGLLAVLTKTPGRVRSAKPTFAYASCASSPRAIAARAWASVSDRGRGGKLRSASAYARWAVSARRRSVRAFRPRRRPGSGRRRRVGSAQGTRRASQPPAGARRTTARLR